MNRFIAGVSAQERELIFRLTAAVVAELTAWAAPYGIFEAVRFPAVAISMAAAAPWCDLAALTEMAMIPAWIYAIDDAYDRRTIPPGARLEGVRRYTRVAGGHGGPWPGDAYAAALADLTARLARRPLWPALRGEWSASCRRMLAGMAFECDTADAVAAGAPRPTFRAYMQHGLHSIGVPMYLAGAWIVGGDPRTIAHLPALRRLARASGRAVRLANDLRTHDKERGEGNFNALMLLSGADGSPAAARTVARRLREYMARLLRAGDALDFLPAARLITRVTRFAVDLYADYDYHTLPHAHVLRA